ncbi:prepilin-type cleavage/methylation domain-containing protein [Pusillimonas sp. CC-YST705]|uniref:Prepilin-type cleavage/methylation domain-containing protein n=1 Tax=Mesopusillimonas faecipullorum TaxID=2755040 RepID=A0ABS8CA62_9BURK|nr:type 4 pilus major pilin [Mesopusillimonas faecipullorum]MCB5362921.1 prepilin-type cleavage/methylation domain-containing protein [Mesopusillimonas faecipullorum]
MSQTLKPLVTQARRQDPRRAARPSSRGRHRQHGDALVNLMLAVMIMILLAVIGIPAINGIVIEGRTPDVAAELQRFMARMRAMGTTGTNLPYSNVSNASNLAPATREATTLRTTGNIVAHRLGGTGTGNSGTVSLAAANLAGAGLGSAYSLTVTDVHDKACPTLASIMSTSSEEMTLNGNAIKNTTTPYNAADAQQHCVDGENNDFVFTAR